jgi:hypothetical protein
MPDGASGFECAGGRFRIDSEWPAMRELIGFVTPPVRFARAQPSIQP